MFVAVSLANCFSALANSTFSTSTVTCCRSCRSIVMASVLMKTVSPMIAYLRLYGVTILFSTSLTFLSLTLTLTGIPSGSWPICCRVKRSRTKLIFVCSRNWFSAKKRG